MSFAQNKYQVIKKAVPYELANFIFNYFLLKRDAVSYMYKNNLIAENGMFGTWKDQQVPNVYSHYAEYPAGGFYDWHIDSDIVGMNEPPVRKISMTCLLSHESEFEGGGLELMSDGKIARPKQGQAIFFASYIRHRVIPITKGIRKSLVMWFGGPSFK